VFRVLGTVLCAPLFFVLPGAALLALRLEVRRSEAGSLRRSTAAGTCLVLVGLDPLRRSLCVRFGGCQSLLELK
jgi:hypothetical protein